jgi:hypothetical protein
MSALNNSPLLGASGSQGYFLQRSVRLRSSASAYFSRTLASTTNRKTFTQSIWLKRGALGADQYPVFAFNGGNTLSYYWYFDTLNRLAIQSNIEGVSNNFNLLTTQVFRDPSSWYHIIVSMDTTQATASNRLKIYVNGVEVTVFTTATYPSLNFDNAWNNSAIANTIGRNSTGTFDGYLEEINFIDGQALTPTSFGAFNPVTGVWQPKKYVGTYGTNGFYLNFEDNSAATAAAIGKDSSGNGNNWTPNNISVTAGVTYDSMTDVPTLTNTTTSNYCVLNPLIINGSQITAGNLNLNNSATAYRAVGSFGITSGKWYWEATTTATNFSLSSGVWKVGAASVEVLGYGDALSWGWYANSGQKWFNTANTQWGSAFTSTNDVLGVAFNADTGDLFFYKNGVLQGGGAAFTGLTSGPYFPAISVNATGTTSSVNFGQRPFSYTPPTGFVALNTFNLPAPTISNGATQMAATLWTGTGSSALITNAVNGVAFQPDLVWTKARSAAYDNQLTDSVRGVNKELQSNGTAVESNFGTVTAFNSNGFTVGTGASSNQNGITYINWNWKAGGAAVTNTSGTISSQVSANPTAGFSVVTYTGTGTNGATFGHGLGVAPAFGIWKVRTGTIGNWVIYHQSLGATRGLNFTTGAATTSAVFFNNTAPTSTVWSLGTVTDVNRNTSTYVNYAFSEIAGYSKFGTYTGNGSNDGPFIYLGFRPRFILVKRTDAAGNDWAILDSSRSTYNLNNLSLSPSLSSAESSTAYFQDFLSNGYKIRDNGTGQNANGGTYVYAAFAENPFKLALAR